jgi:diguanylate cyclase (GGDEF)-like protein
MPSPFARHLLSLPRWGAIGAVVAVSVLLSLAVTRAVIPPAEVAGSYRRVLLIAVLVPTLVATPVAVTVVHLLHLLSRLRDEASRLASTDALTGVLNRRSFDEIAMRELQRALAGGRPLSLLILDVDDFKHVNDRHGHAAGDRVLEAVAARCVQAVRPGDPIGRWGGEEFVVLLPGAGPAEGAIVAERLRVSVRETPVRLDGVEVAVTVSVGLASVRADTDMLARLLGRADAAMYRAKTAGKDRVVTD